MLNCIQNKQQLSYFFSANIRMYLILVVSLVVVFNPISLLAGDLTIVSERDIAKELNNTLVTPSDEEIIASANELKILSQVIAKDYFYISQHLREEQAQEEIKRSILDMDRALTTLGNGVKDSDSVNMLGFLVDTNLEFKTLLDKKYSKEHGSQVLDYSETMYEGAQSIISHFQDHQKKNTDSMHNLVLQQQLILQRISKFYIAYQAGFSDQRITNQLLNSVSEFDKGVKEISQYKYPDNLKKEVVKLKKYWPIAKKFYLGMEKGDLTLIVFISTDHMKLSLDKLYVSQI